MLLSFAGLPTAALLNERSHNGALDLLEAPVQVGQLTLRPRVDRGAQGGGLCLEAPAHGQGVNGGQGMAGHGRRSSASRSSRSRSGAMSSA